MTRRQSDQAPEGEQVNRRFPRPGALFSLAAAAILLFAGAGPAVAQGGPAAAGARTDASSTSSTATLDDGSAVDSAAAAGKAQDYWTPERMQNAVPFDSPASDTLPSGSAEPTPAPTGSPGSIDPAAPTVPNQGGPKDPLITESAAVGKVFFHNPSDGKDYVCSGSALNGPSKQMVITAGHCVHGGQGKTWMTNWIYAPRFRSGNYPFGTYAAKQFRTFNAWIDSSDHTRDVGLVTTWPQNGTKLVDATGGQGLSWNYSHSVDVTVLGYPVDRDNGQIQQWCTGTTSGSGGYIQIHCNFGGGSSGGPWLRAFDDSTGLGYVNGVMSTLDSNGWNASSYFDDAVKTMVDAQGSVT
ncbi:trypsin-like serine peptidase [Kitasatospora viridis]|uniref:trypsin-like serine peptidase n=1 Tax=Kitasatospora viridis TaxID=281105 RepID=UPI001FE33A88|nr:trypsin-like peptidase domain-containing protein [Kitasatospora viridis]